MIQERRCQEILRNNKRENEKHIPHNCQVGDKVAKKRFGILPKLRQKCDGPHEVIAVDDNGTLWMRNGAITERLNIRGVLHM